MSAIVVTALCCATLLVVLWHARPFVDRLVAVVERRAERPAPLPKQEPLPAWADLYVMQESEGWAREQVKARIYEMFAEYGDWDRVAQAVQQGGLR